MEIPKKLKIKITTWVKCTTSEYTHMKESLLNTPRTPAYLCILHQYSEPSFETSQVSVNSGAAEGWGMNTEKP